MKKVVLFIHGVETLSYFSEELGRAFENLGLTVFLFDLQYEEDEQQFENLKMFIEKGNTFVVSFNFNGIRGEEIFYGEDGELFWKKAEVPFFNIMVDHPFYYPELLDKVERELGSRWYRQIVIDLDHKRYMERFYPVFSPVYFLPLAGAKIEENMEKVYEVVFTGNYVPPENFRKYIERTDEEYTAFYEGIIADLIQNPHVSMEEMFENHLRRELGDISEKDLKICMGNMIFIDLYVRFYFRGEIIKTLAEAGITVHIWGGGWEQLETSAKEYIVVEGSTDTQGCLRALAKAKVSINVMPWFKKGAHDRVYSSMLNRAVCVTDESEYLCMSLKEDEVVFYSLKEYQKLPGIVKDLLNDEGKREYITKQAYKTAREKETWVCRAGDILKFVGEEKY